MMTERDIEILSFINQFGFCEISHLNYQFKLNKPYNYELMAKLIKRGLIEHKPKFFSRNGIYKVTKKGASLTSLPVLKKIPIAIYNHEILLIELYFKLMEMYPNTEWISERQLSWDQFSEGIGKKGHVADAILQFKDKKVAIELELSLKGRKRIKKILEQYAKEWHIDEVWYFCDDKVIKTLTELSEKKPYVKIFRLQDVLHAKS